MTDVNTFFLCILGFRNWTWQPQWEHIEHSNYNPSDQDAKQHGEAGTQDQVKTTAPSDDHET